MSSPDTRTTTPSPSPSPSTSPTPATAASFLADEDALKRAFDLEFNAAIAEARSRLGDATSLAPRVVETAFVNVWQQRGSLTAHDQFKQVLLTEIHHGAARALSRRHAAGRFGGGGGSVARDEQTMTGTHPATADADPEAAWSRIARTIHGEGHTAEAHRAAASATRHDAAVHMKEVAKRPSWVIPVIILVVALVLAVWGVRALSNAGEDDAVASAVASPAIQPIASSSGQIGSVKLGDGTQMKLGPETKVYLPEQFPTKMRAIRVDGTASFDVAPNQTQPFRVVANHTHFIATGTKFAVSSYPADSSAKVFVQEGSVTVKFGKQIATVAANQAMVVDTKGIRALPDDQKAEAFGWVNGQATAHGQLRHVVEALTRWFNYDVKVIDRTLLEREASFAVPLDSSRLAISQVEKSANVKFAYEGETKVFRDAGGKGAAPAKKK
jgi:ferric-dicitrate binding protein FerR (iron transport regulator)